MKISSNRKLGTPSLPRQRLHTLGFSLLIATTVGHSHSHLNTFGLTYHWLYLALVHEVHGRVTAPTSKHDL